MVENAYCDIVSDFELFVCRRCVRSADWFREMPYRHIFRNVIHFIRPNPNPREPGSG